MNVGHARREIADAVFAQLREGYYFHPTMFTTPVVEELAARLATHSPQAISRFYFMTTGSEAVETAIKLARQVHVNAGRLGRHKLIARGTLIMDSRWVHWQPPDGPAFALLFPR